MPNENHLSVARTARYFTLGEKTSGVTDVCSLVLVPLEPVKSAEPPSSAGIAGNSASITFCDDCRVANLALSVMNACAAVRAAFVMAAATSGVTGSSNAAFGTLAARLPDQAMQRSRSRPRGVWRPR